MTMHDRSLRKQALLAAAARLPKYLERKDDEPSLVEIKKSFEDFMRGFETFKSKNDSRLDEMEKRGTSDVVTREEIENLNKGLDEIKSNINSEIAKLRRPETDKNGIEIKQEMKDYSRDFGTYFRKGQDYLREGLKGLGELEAKAMAVQSDPDGGYTVRPEMDNAIDSVLKQVSPIRDFATVRQIGSDAYKKLVNEHGTTSGWVGESEDRPQTKAPTFRALDFPAMELYAMPAATQKMLDDSFLNIDQWLADEVSLEFAFQEGAAFVAGDGVGKPHGFLAYPTVANADYAWGKVGYVPTGKAGDYNVDATLNGGADALIDCFYALKSPYRKNASWMMNNTTLGKTRKLKDANGRYLVDQKLTVSTDAGGGLIESILGKSVAEVVDMPDPAANSLSVAFGDWKRAYIIIDRKGTRVLRDPFTAKPYVLFYTTKRVGGGVQHFEAFKLLKFAVS